jgi:hypothetical protein
MFHSCAKLLAHISWVPVVYSCNPGYSGGRHQEACGLKPAWKHSSRDPILKNPSQKWAGGTAQGVDPEFKPQYCKEKKIPSGICNAKEDASEQLVLLTREHKSLT